MFRSFFWFLLAAIPAIPLTAAGEELSIVSSDQTGFHFIVAIDPASLDVQTETDSLPGYYELITVGIPHGARVELLSAVAKGRITGRIASVGDAERVSAVGRPLAEISEPFAVRGRQMVNVRLNPLTPDGGCYDQIEIRLAFRGGTADGETRPDPWFDRVFAKRMANFDQFRAWPVAADAASKQAAIEGPFANGGTWYKIAVNQTGLCRINGGQLQQAGLSLTDLASDDIRLFSAGGAPLPIDNTDPRPTLTEVAIIVEDGGDGFFGANDYVLFFAEAPDRWVYRAGGSASYLNNVYDDRNVYWLSASGGTGLRMQTESVDPTLPSDTTVTSFTRSAHVEQDNVVRQHRSGQVDGYYVWYWTSTSPVTLFVPTPGRASGEPASLLISAVTYGPGYTQATVNGSAATAVELQINRCLFNVNNLVDGLNEIRLVMSGSTDYAPHLNYAELTYRSSLAPVSGVLDAAFGGMVGPARLEVVDNFSGPVIGLRVDNPLAPVRLEGFSRTSGTLALTVSTYATQANRFLFSSLGSAIAPAAIQQVTPVDLYAVPAQTDVLIITSAQLKPAMADYIAYRQQSGLSIRTVTMEEIRDNFSFGMYDPTAIRDYLKYAYENYLSPTPYAVLLVGDGSFDFLDNLGTGVTNVVPPFIRPDDEYKATTDDFYVYFGRYDVLDSDTSYVVEMDRGFDMVIARWPVRTAAEINTIVDKVKQYESPSTLGPWRSKVTLVADDEHGGRFHNETFHVEIGAEPLDADHIPRTFRRDKIYLWDYPRVGREKPAVNDAIVRSINEGTLVIDYIGHGNPDVWADEHVFSRDDDLPRLRNVDRLPLFYAASCAIGFFDDPFREGMAEELLVYPGGGAIAVMSAMRLVYASENAALNNKVFDILLTADSLSMAEALFLAKLERQYNGGSVPFPVTNDRSYLFFGDPLLKLGMPRLKIEFDETPDSLMALGRSQVSGRIVDRNGMPYAADGRLIIDVYDSDREKQFRLLNSSGQVVQRVDYKMPGPTIYRGTATIENGQFSFEFISPLDIGYGGQEARVMAYAELAESDGVGLIDSLPVSLIVSDTTDKAGPSIAYEFPGTTGFVDGGTVTSDDVLRIGLADSSGINLAGGLGHGITLIIDDESENMVDLTGLFAYAQDNSTQGQVEYHLAGFEPGRHTFKIKAWDNANNSSTVTFTAEVASIGGPALVDLLNYPNPMQESTRFSYRLTADVQRISLEIFTLSGRKIRSFERYPTDPGYYDDIIWYGEDFVGDRVGTGVYIYKATAYPLSGEAVESFGKVVVLN